MNRVILIGRLTKDVELRYTQTNIACATFNVAINNGKDSNGNDRPADFIRCVLWEKQAENIAKYTSKGSQIAVDGSIKNDNYEDEKGNKHYRTYVLAKRVEFLNSKNNSQPLPTEPDNLTNKSSFTPEEIDNIPDDDLPF